MLRERDNYQVCIDWNGQQITTLRDILPETNTFRALFVGKRPSPESVEEGHYFRGTQGRAFWNKLKEYGILDFERDEYPDDKMASAGFGLIDVVKSPGYYKQEPRAKQYDHGIPEFLEKARVLKPRVIVFIYRNILVEILKRTFRSGFLPDLEAVFNGAKVFVFPMPRSWKVTSPDIEVSLSALRDYLAQFNPDGTER